MSELINNEIGAKLYGEDIAQLPLDLYIPPEALEVYLESFEGPLDLLLYLIRKDNIDVLDIPMANLTSQYINYVEQMKTIASLISRAIKSDDAAAHASIKSEVHALTAQFPIYQA